MQTPNPGSQPFQTQGEFATLANTNEQIPQYLFRTWAPQTNGFSNADMVMSAAVSNGRTASDLLTSDRGVASDMLQDHLLWRNRPNDNLMSWTSSFIYAVQLARYRQEKDRDHPEPSNIYICVLDTRQFRRNTFLPATALLQAYSIPDTRKTTHRYYEGEYLSQGALDIRGKSKTTAFENLLSNRLPRIFPPLTSSLLWLAVQRHRETWGRPSRITEEDIQVSLQIATSCFGGEWVRPMMIILLSLWPRSLEDNNLLEVFRSNHGLDGKTRRYRFQIPF
ncbi:hypothetical protein ABW20_dc0103017 [Dactylellina cionopaga]|nr:hypothetical protein ABW20_dc0103017 [Dactylellina cionopaga]